MAYVDGELDPAARAQVEAAMRDDPQIEKRVAQHRELKAKIQQAYAADLTEAVPERLVAAAHGRGPVSDPHVVDLGQARAAIASKSLRLRWRQPQWRSDCVYGCQPPHWCRSGVSRLAQFRSKHDQKCPRCAGCRRGAGSRVIEPTRRRPFARLDGGNWLEFLGEIRGLLPHVHDRGQGIQCRPCLPARTAVGGSSAGAVRCREGWRFRISNGEFLAATRHRDRS